MSASRTRSIIKAILAFLIGCLVAVYAIGFSLREAERQVAESAGGGTFADDGRVRLRAVLEQIAKDPEVEVAGKDIDAIKSSLIDTPLNSKALAILGYVAASGANSELCQSRLMTLADRVSRREPLSQIWKIEQASASGDVRGAVRHYNAALSVNPSLNEKLLPILASAIDYPEVRSALTPLVGPQTSWMPAFLNVAAASSNLNSLLDLTRPASVKIFAEPFRDANAQVLFRLASSGRLDEAAQYAGRYVPGYASGVFSDISISAATLNKGLGVLAWTLTDNDQISAITNAEGELSVTIQPTARGAILTRYMAVTPGKHPFMQTVQRVSGPSPSSLQWQASCPAYEAGMPFWSQLVPSGDAAVQYRSSLIVPTTCRAVKFELLVVGPESQLPSQVTISNLTLL